MADVPPHGSVEPKPDVGISTLIAGDGVRGIGALFVFTTHVCLLADPVPNNNLLSYGWAAPILGHIDLALSAFFGARACATTSATACCASCRSSTC